MRLALGHGFELSNESGQGYQTVVLIKGKGDFPQWSPDDIVWSNGGPGIVARDLVTRLVNNMPPSQRDKLNHAQINLVLTFCEELRVTFRLT
jgi:hypothetical protein